MSVPPSVTSEPPEDWVDLSGPPDGPGPVPAIRVPQPLWYFPPRDEWPGRLWWAARRAARRLRPLAASVAIHMVGVYLGVTAIGAAFDGPPPGGRPAGDVTPPLVASVASVFFVPQAGVDGTMAMPMPDTSFGRRELCPGPGAGDSREWPVVESPPPAANSVPTASPDASVPRFGPPTVTVVRGDRTADPSTVNATPADDEPLAPFSIPGGRPRPAAVAAGQADVPADGFRDAAGHAVRSVTFLCDPSGSMISKMASLKDQLAKAVTSLGPDQAFNFIVMRDTEPDTLSRTGLVPPTTKNKQEAFRFLEDLTNGGTSDPIPALRLALRQKPALLYVITDGDFPNNAAVLAEVRRLNADKAVRIDTIAFVNDKDTDTDFIDLLETIARENGGQFRRVRDQDLYDYPQDGFMRPRLPAPYPLTGSMLGPPTTP